MINTTQKEVIKHFIARPEMFIGSALTQDKVVSFIHGMESMISDSETRLSYSIERYLKSEHNISGFAFGWPAALEYYALNRLISWWDAFKQISNLLLQKEIHYWLKDYEKKTSESTEPSQRYPDEEVK